MATLSVDFTAEEVERARRYHRPLYAALLVDVVLGLGILAALTFGSIGDHLYAAVDGLSWWGATLAFTALVVACSSVVRLPLAFWRGYVIERRYGFSTQRAGGWLLDRAKGVGIGVAVTSLGMLGFVAAARAFPGLWPAVTAPAASLLVVVLSFVAPVLLEPVFNRFRRLDDRELAEDLRALAIRAGVPVRDVLVADASRRTRKENAYVSGLASTRRVVLYDTLLERAPAPELRLITAHELAHRREGHVAKGTLIGAAGAAASVLVLWGLLSWPALRDTIGVTGAGDPRVAPFVLLVVACLELATLPFVTAISRRWERVADRLSLELTGDLSAFESTHLSLARANLSDLDPPRILYLALFTHPTPPERIAAARAALGGIVARGGADGPISAGEGGGAARSL